DVLRSFQSGDLHDLCALGRAECLASLQRYPKALEAFTEIKERLIGKDRSRSLDRGAVRATVTTIGELLIQDGRLELGIDYLKLAMDLVGADDSALRGSYLVRVAGTLEEMAHAVLRDEKADTQDRVLAQERLADAAGM